MSHAIDLSTDKLEYLKHLTKEVNYLFFCNEYLGAYYFYLSLGILSYIIILSYYMCIFITGTY